MARMSIDDKFLRDPRVTRLAERLGWNRYEARGRLLDVFAVCYDLETDIITPEDANAAADEARLADVMLAVGLADLDDGGIRVHGAAARIEYLVKKVEAGRKGGLKSAETRRKKSEAKRSSASSKPEAVGNPPDPVPDLPPDPVPDLPPDPVPDLQNSLPRAIPPSTEHGQQVAAPPEAGSKTGQNRPAGDQTSPIPPPVPAPGKSAWHRRSAWWAMMLEADARVRTAGIEPNAPPMPKACAGENERNLNACEKQLLEGGDDAETVDRKLRHLIAYRERECIRDRTRRWLSPAALWDPKRANYAYDRPLDEADKSPLARAGPRSSAGRAEQQTIRPKHTDDAPPIPSWSKA